MSGVSYFLEGFTVLDCTRLLPGAVASLYLADMGAEVIKVEQPTTGEGTYLDVAMLDGVLTWEVVVASEQFSDGKAVGPRGHPLTGGVVSCDCSAT